MALLVGLTIRTPSGFVDFPAEVPYVSHVQSIGAVLVLTRPIVRPSHFAAFLLLFLFSSCGIWDSVTAYFNTYYNAKRLFEDAEDELWTQKDVVQLGRNYYLGTFVGANKTKFTQVIEKCSKLLQYHPESGLVDGALFLIGMSSYYQGDFQQADRKFRELLDHDPGRSLAVRGGIMLAYTKYRLAERDTAAAIAGRLYQAATDDGDDQAIGQTAILLGQIERDRENPGGARPYFLKAGETAENPELRATALLTAAQLAERVSDFAAADSAYRAAERVSRTYVGEFRGQLGVARMKALEGDFAGALERLQDLRDNQNYREFFGEISLETGNVYRLSGDYSQAIRQYGYVDTAFARTESAAKADYELGLLYETKSENLDSARAAYARGRNHAGSAPVAELLTEKADLLTSYIRYRTDLLRADSIRAVWVVRRDSLLAQRDSLEKLPLSSGRGTTDSLAAKKDSLPPAVRSTALPNIDSLDQQIANVQMELATLFYTGMGRSDSAAYWYRIFLEKYPYHSGAPRALYTLAQIAGQDSTRPRGTADSLYRALVRRFPETDFANEARKMLGMPQVKRSKGEAEEEYGAASDLIKEGKYAEAVTALRKITTAFPTSPIAPRAQYAIGWLYENQIVSPDSAIANYQLLVSKFPASQYVPLVQPKLLAVQAARAGVRMDTTKVTAPKDTVAVQKPPAPTEILPPAPGSGRRARQPQKPPPDRE